MAGSHGGAHSGEPSWLAQLYGIPESIWTSRDDHKIQGFRDRTPRPLGHGWDFVLHPMLMHFPQQRIVSSPGVWAAVDLSVYHTAQSERDKQSTSSCCVLDQSDTWPAGGPRAFAQWMLCGSKARIFGDYIMAWLVALLSKQRRWRPQGKDHCAGLYTFGSCHKDFSCQDSQGTTISLQGTAALTPVCWGLTLQQHRCVDSVRFEMWTDGIDINRAGCSGFGKSGLREGSTPRRRSLSPSGSAQRDAAPPPPPPSESLLDSPASHSLMSWASPAAPGVRHCFSPS